MWLHGELRRARAAAINVLVTRYTFYISCVIIRARHARWHSRIAHALVLIRVSISQQAGRHPIALLPLFRSAFGLFIAPSELQNWCNKQISDGRTRTRATPNKQQAAFRPPRNRSLQSVMNRSGIISRVGTWPCLLVPRSLSLSDAADSVCVCVYRLPDYRVPACTSCLYI